MQETWVGSLGLEDPLEKGMTTHSSILAWKIPWTRGTWQLLTMGLQESDTTEGQNECAELLLDKQKHHQYT